MSNFFLTVGPNLRWPWIAASIREDFGCYPKYWLGPDQWQSDVSDRFPEAVYHDMYEATKGIFPSTGDVPSIELDSGLLEQYRAYESLALKIMDRLDAGHTFSYTERQRHYRRLLSYYIGLFEAYAPSFVLFKLAPHTVSSFVLYAVAEQHDVDTFVITPTHFPNISYIRSGLFTQPEGLQTEYERLKSTTDAPDLSAETADYISSLQHSYDDAKPATIPSTDAFISIGEKTVKTVLSLLMNLYTAFEPQPAQTLKEQNKPIEESSLSTLQYSYYDIWATKHRRTLQHTYEDLSVDADPTVPFVYVPLHYQPERSTLPEGGVYHDQVLFVRLLASVVPDDWKIYVKEHRAQFSQRDSHQGRSVQTYRDLHAIDDVVLVDMTIPSFDLIDAAIAVATVTGTAGWEAVVRGTPSIVSGFTWYAVCDGVFVAQTREEFTSAVSTIRDGVDIDENAVRTFAEAAERIGYEGDIGNSAKHLDQEKNSANFYARLRSLIEETG